MSRICPITNEKVVYLTCCECEERFTCTAKQRDIKYAPDTVKQTLVTEASRSYINAHMNR